EDEVSSLAKTRTRLKRLTAMKYRLWTCLCGGLLGVVCLLPGGPAVAETSGLPKEPEPVEVLGRGPVHEAFARPLPADEKPGPTPTTPRPGCPGAWSGARRATSGGRATG